ncbi:PHD-finger [Dictyocaulus viviparus]|uniref:PHD-finger n=1 Tax=Dictyocaulus viviparus TaxID=29172 RepID=A0A0D8XQ38_DICVI|nr:PHD-finger [Dictyocaulus viviparus]
MVRLINHLLIKDGRKLWFTRKHPQELCIQQQKEHDEHQLRTANDGMYQKRVGEEVSEESRSCLPETNSDTTTHSMRQEVLEESPKHLKIVISNPHSDSASSAFSPPPQTPRATTETCVLTPSTLDPHHDNDSDTIPFFDDALGAVENMLHKPAPTTFCAENSLDEHSSYLHHKKKKKKDVILSIQRVVYVEYRNCIWIWNTAFVAQREPKFTLKIRIGDQTSTTETLAESSPQPEPVKIKFKNLPLEEPREFQPKVVPPLKLGALATHTELKEERAESKRKYYTKAELKASSSYLSAFFVKQSKEETSRKKKDEEERKREKEERRRQEKEERKRIEQEREKEARERERELERGREREVEREREQDLFERKLKEQHEKEKQRRDKDVRLPPPVTAFVKADKKDKRLKEKRRSKEEKKSQVVLEKSVVENNSDEGDDDNSDVVWICPSCSVAWTEGATMVCCDMCDNWFHWHCVGLIIAPPDDVPWFCQKCAGKRQSDKSNKRTGSKLEGSNRKRKKLF